MQEDKKNIPQENDEKVKPQEVKAVTPNEVKEEAVTTPEKVEVKAEEKTEVKDEEKVVAKAEKIPGDKVKSRFQGKKPFSKGSRGKFGRKEKNEPDDGILEHVIKINRVSKVVKGGKNFSFSALIVAGDGAGKVGMGLGKSNEVVEAIKKGVMNAKKSLVTVKLKEDTIPHEVIGEYKASRVLMKPAAPGTGVIAGGPVRALCDAVGIKNILTKSLGSRNAINVVRAVIDGFQKLRLKRRG